MRPKRSWATTRQAEEQVNSLSLRGKNYNALFEISIYMYSRNFTELPANRVNFVYCKIKRGLGLRHCATSQEVPGSIPGGHWGFFRGTPDRTMCPEVDSASEIEYQGFLLG